MDDRLERLCFCGDVFLPFMGPFEEEGRDGTTQNVRGNFPGGDPRGRRDPTQTRNSHIIYASLLRDASKDEREVA